ncbi:hypothetical protein TNCV_3823051 [Trichonephila clavipes]|nr:hypothetical protein TNCV_3823051 [Trichonephila clavipes]
MHLHAGPAPGIMVQGGIGYHSRPPLVRIAGSLNSLRYISEVLEPQGTLPSELGHSHISTGHLQSHPGHGHPWVTSQLQVTTRVGAVLEVTDFSQLVLSHCGTNCSSNFCRRCSTMHSRRTPNIAVFPLSSATRPPGTRFS